MKSLQAQEIYLFGEISLRQVLTFSKNLRFKLNLADLKQFNFIFFRVIIYFSRSEKVSLLMLSDYLFVFV